MSITEEAIIREALMGANALANAPEFKAVLRYLQYRQTLGTEVCVTAREDLQVHRAQGATNELRTVLGVLDSPVESGQRRAKMRREA